MMKRLMAIMLCILMTVAVLSACGKNISYQDGTYTGKSDIFEGDEEGNGDGYGEVKLTIKDGKITDCEFATYEPDGTLKDENYGKVDGEVRNEDYFRRAQQAVKGSAMYADLLVKSGDPNTFESDIDAISGATYSYDQFIGAVYDALAQAQDQ